MRAAAAFARHPRLARAVHTSAARLVGRKQLLGYKRTSAAHRKAHSAIYENEDAAYEDDNSITEWAFDNHHTYGHMLLESMRDVRKYARQIKYELPTLAEHARPFEPPSKRSILRFERSVTTGEKFPAQDRKAVLRVTVAQLGLAGPELHKFLLLAGPRYNPETDELRMSEKREITSLLNKKRLADTLVALIAEAKKPGDTFADVPLAFPHHKYRPEPAFPSEWLPKP
ncbi:37S ribosomal protein S24, mitochondrial [Coemansia javaensis]|uniref:37S ribosomal protein S24, mitochondrial n=1 Tax=Coemansia javaensis TaxID=2761396 RepID=A0A9W8H2E3_9FUNG|nr:37S ribosomal protein S24, mitochondrial [Coemansia javaensis]